MCNMVDWNYLLRKKLRHYLEWTHKLRVTGKKSLNRRQKKRYGRLFAKVSLSFQIKNWHLKKDKNRKVWMSSFLCRSAKKSVLNCFERNKSVNYFILCFKGGIRFECLQLPFSNLKNGFLKTFFISAIIKEE